MAKRVKHGKAYNIGQNMVRIVGNNPNITDGVSIGANTPDNFQVNHDEIIVGAEASKSGKTLYPTSNNIQVLSAEPMFNGKSPVQLLYGGMAPDKVFAMQEQYKDIHGINDDGSRQNAQFGILKKIKEKLSGKSNNNNNTQTPIKETEYVNYFDATDEQKSNLTDKKGKYNIQSVGDYGDTHFSVIEARYKSLTDSMKRKGFSSEEINRLSPFLITQQVLEGGYKLSNDTNNFGGLLVPGTNKKMSFKSVDDFNDYYLSNLDEKWGDDYLGKGKGWRNAKTLKEYADIINREDLRLYNKEAHTEYNKQHRDKPAYIYTPLWENNNTGLMSEPKFGGIYPRVYGMLDLLKTRIEDWNNIAKTNNIVKKQFGGRKKFQLGGEDEDKYNTLLNNYKIAVQNRKNADNNISETTKSLFDAKEKIGEATINKYKSTNADLLVYPGWSNTEEGAKKYLIENGIRESIGAQEVADYFNSYASSPGFQRIIDNQISWGQKRHPYRKIYNPNYTKLGFSNAARQFRNTLLDKPMTTFGVFDMDSYPGMGFNYSQYAPYNHIIINAAGNPFLNQQKEQFPYWYELTHEMLHDYNFTRDGQGEALDQNKNTSSGHDSWRNEKHSDLEALRFMLYKYNIYDSRGDKDAKVEDIKKLRDMFPKLRPLEQMDDETAAWMINHVASANKIDKESKRNRIQFGSQTNIKSLGERPNAKFGKEMSNPVKKANKYFERKLKEENPKMSFPEKLQKIHNEYKELMSPPSIEDIEKMFKKIYKGEPKRGLKKRLERGLYNKYKLENINPQIDSSYLFNQYTINNNSENKRTKALYGWERDPNTGLIIPSLDFSQNKQRQILFGIHPNPANTQYNSQTFNTGIPQPTVGTVPKLYEPALNVVLGNKTNQPGTPTTTSATTTPNSSGLSAIGADLIGAGINAAGSLIAAGINQNAINNQKFTPRRAVLLNPVKLKTKINIGPQLAKLREMQAQIADAARRTSGSSREAYRRILAGHNRVLESAMDLYGYQENQGTQLINQDRLNQQSIANQNATNVINNVNTNIAGKDSVHNDWHMLTAQNWINPINVTAGSIVGERGAIAREEARRNNAANLAMMSLAYPDAARMIMNGDYWQKAFNGYYNMLNNKVRV